MDSMDDNLAPNQEAAPPFPITNEPTITPAPQVPPAVPVGAPAPSPAVFPAAPFATQKEGPSGKPKIFVWIFITLIALALVGGVVYLLSSGSLPKIIKNEEMSAAPTPQAKISPTPEMAASDTATWPSYVKKDAKFSLKYPENLKAEEGDDGSLYLSLWGPTQKEGTEFYDGISLNFKEASLGGKTLKEVADGRREEFSGVFETDEPSEVHLGGLLGYKFHVKGNVEADYYYLSLGENSYLEVMDATIDPASSGFAETVKLILSTLILVD